MLRKYKSLERALESYNFDPMTIALFQNHIMGRNTKNDKMYICHLNLLDDGTYVIDNCKVYENEKEASLVMINLISRSMV